MFKSWSQQRFAALSRLGVCDAMPAVILVKEGSLTVSLAKLRAAHGVPVQKTLILIPPASCPVQVVGAGVGGGVGGAGVLTVTP